MIDTARERGVRDLSEIQLAVLVVCGEISIVPSDKKDGNNTGES
jgi:uncharacterized membrane protein YcaP (DUF421 family)